MTVEIVHDNHHLVTERIRKMGLVLIWTYFLLILLISFKSK